MNKRIQRRQSVLCLTPLALCLSAAFAGVPAATTIRANVPRVASVLPVGTCADNGASNTLRSVVATAISGDTIDLTGLDCGTITLLTGEILVHVDDLTIDGPGRDALTIDGNNSGRVFRHDGAGTLTLSGLTITHGIADSATQDPFSVEGAYGGCILSDHRTEQYPSAYGSVTIIDSTVTGCHAHMHPPNAGRARGGGIAAARNITLTRSTVSNCEAYNEVSLSNGGGGGALFADYLITVADSVISDNTSRAAVAQMRGGGISAYGDLLISNSTVTRNFVGCDTTSLPCYYGLGGGVDAFGTVTISTSVISDNISEANRGVEGGLSVRGILHLSSTTVSGNVARGPTTVLRGGGIALTTPVVGPSDISGATISGNSAAEGGGIYAGAYATLTIDNSTVSGNSASDAGGGIFTTGTYLRGPYSAFPLSVRNSTITANSSSGSRGGGGIVDLHVPYLGYSDFQSSIVAGNANKSSDATYDSDLAALTAGVSGANNLIIAANGLVLPSDTLNTDPMLGPLQDNGGPTLTHALMPGSLAIDAGNNAASLSTDQRGDGFARVFGKAADIGAFEVQTGTTPDVIFADGFDEGTR